MLNSAFIVTSYSAGRGRAPNVLAGGKPVVQKRAMTRRGYFLRLAFSIVYDLFDFTLGRIPIFGAVTEGVGTVVLMALWGPAGLVNLLELFDFTEQGDAFIPTATLVALYVGWREGFLSGKSSEDSQSRDIRESGL
jgi:hypothetical protein